jgi:hypothetical protein
MSSVQCKKIVCVHLFSCNTVPNIVLTVMCICVIYKCSSWGGGDQQQDLSKPSYKNSQAKPSVGSC